MKHCFGISNSSPATVYGKLIEKGLATSLTAHPVGTLLLPKTKAPKGDLIFLTFEDLVKNLSVLNLLKYKDVTVYVFASPIRLNELVGIHLLDVESAPGAVGFGFNLKHTPDYAKCRRIGKKTGGSDVSTVNVNIIETLTTHIKQGSILTPLMTFLYSLPSATLQGPVKKAVAKILVENKPPKLLDKFIASISEYELSLTAKERLMDILKSEAALKYKEAFKFRAENKKKPIGATALAKKFGVDVYEINYLLAVVYPKETSPKGG